MWSSTAIVYALKVMSLLKDNFSVFIFYNIKIFALYFPQMNTIIFSIKIKSK